MDIFLQQVWYVRTLKVLAVIGALSLFIPESVQTVTSSVIQLLTELIGSAR